MYNFLVNSSLLIRLNRSSVYFLVITDSVSLFYLYFKFKASISSSLVGIKILIFLNLPSADIVLVSNSLIKQDKTVDLEFCPAAF